MSSNRKPYKFGNRKLDPNVIEGTPYFYLHIDWFAEFHHLKTLESCLDLAHETEYQDVREHDVNSKLEYHRKKYNKYRNDNDEDDEKLDDEMDETSSISSEEINGYLEGAGLLAKANVIGQHRERRIKDHKRECAIKRRKEELKRMQTRMNRKKTQSFRKAKIKKQKELRAAAKKQRQMALDRIAANSEKKVNQFQNNSRDIQINFRGKKKGDYFLDYSKYDENDYYDDDYYDYEEEEEEEEIDEQYKQYVYNNAPSVPKKSNNTSNKKSNNRSNKKSNRKANKKSNKKQTKHFSETNDYDSELQKALQASLEFSQQNDHNFSSSGPSKSVNEMSDLERAIQESLNMTHNEGNHTHLGNAQNQSHMMGEEGFDIEQSLRNDTDQISSSNNYSEYRGNGSEGEPEGEEEGDPYLRRALEESMTNFPNLSEEQQLEIALAESLKYMSTEENFDEEEIGSIALDSEHIHPPNYHGLENDAEDLYSPRYIDSLNFKMNDSQPEAEIGEEISGLYNCDETPSMKSFPGYQKEQQPPQNSSSFFQETGESSQKLSSPFNQIGEAPHNVSSPFPGMNHSQNLSSPFSQVGESPHKLSSPFGEMNHQQAQPQKLSSPFGQNNIHHQAKTKPFKNIENVAIRDFLTKQQETADYEFAQKLMEEEASVEKKRTENKWETTPFTEVKSKRRKKKRKGKGRNEIKIPMKNRNDPWGAKKKKKQQEQKKKEQEQINKQKQIELRRLQEEEELRLALEASLQDSKPRYHQGNENSSRNLEWSCSVCTLRNHFQLMSCAVCGSSRPDSQI